MYKSPLPPEIAEPKVPEPRYTFPTEFAIVTSERRLSAAAMSSVPCVTSIESAASVLSAPSITVPPAILTLPTSIDAPSIRLNTELASVVILPVPIMLVSDVTSAPAIIVSVPLLTMPFVPSIVSITTLPENLPTASLPEIFITAPSSSAVFVIFTSL